MNHKEFADTRTGKEVGEEITRKEENVAKENGLVIVFEISDDLIEFQEAINVEDCPKEAHITKKVYSSQ